MNKNAFTRVSQHTEDFFTTEELSQLMGLSRSWITERCRYGVLKAQKYKSSSGVWWSIKKQDALDFLATYYTEQAGIVDSQLTQETGAS